MSEDGQILSECIQHMLLLKANRDYPLLVAKIIETMNHIMRIKRQPCLEDLEAQSGINLFRMKAERTIEDVVTDIG